MNRLCTHFCELEAHFDAHSYDLLAIIETFLDGTVDSRLLGLTGMSHYRHDRANRLGAFVFTLGLIFPLLN